MARQTSNLVSIWILTVYLKRKTVSLFSSSNMVSLVVLDEVAVDQPDRLEKELEQPSSKQHKLSKLLKLLVILLLQLQANFPVRAN